MIPFPLADGFAFVFLPQNILLLGTGILLGLLIGILPGIRAIHGAVIFLPIAYSVGLEPKSTLAFLISIYFASLVSGSIVRILGETKSISGTSLAKQLKAANYSALYGITASMLGMLLIITLIRQLELSFGPPEYVLLVFFAFASLSIQGGKYPTRTLISTGFGVFLATIGIDANTGVLRFTFGQPELYDGIEITSIAIGIFVISEVMVIIKHTAHKNSHRPYLNASHFRSTESPGWNWCFIKSSLIGFIIGLIPAAGTSAATTYILSRTDSSSVTAQKEQKVNDTIALDTTRSAAAGGALVPMLAFCIPGNSTTAVMIGALFLYNITPGPTLFIHNIDIFWGLFAAIAVTALLLFSIHRPLALLISRLPPVPAWMFIPALVCLAFIGTYAVHQSLLSLFLMLLFGGAGYVLHRHHYPLIPLLMGFILGELLEDNLRRALTLSGGKIDIFFSGPVCWILWCLILIMVIVPLILRRPVS